MAKQARMVFGRLVRVQKPDRMKPSFEGADPAMRKCLAPECGKLFSSEWAGERRCPRCKRSKYNTVYVAGVDYATYSAGPAQRSIGGKR